MLELAILGLLKERPMHGYELKQQLSQKLGSFWQVSFGSLYPTLRRLDKRGALEILFNDDKTARRRKIYRITETGEHEFHDLIEDRAHSAWEEDKFPLRLAFFRYLTPQVRIRLLERRKAYLREKLADLESSVHEAPGKIDGYTQSLLQHGVDVTRADLAWLDGLIATERRQLAELGEDEPISPDPTPAGGEAGTRPTTRTPSTEGAPARTRP
ncbi:MAG TPA: PadR family transcriptional regulator [Nitriliruptorales bacterium]